MAIRIKLEETLQANKISKNALAREAKVRPNLIYELCEGKTRRIDLDTLSKIIQTLRFMTDKTIVVTDIIEYDSSDE